jgi:hypothetical protein
VAGTKLYSKGRLSKIYNTPYGVVSAARHVYQPAEGGTTFCPMDVGARIMRADWYQRIFPGTRIDKAKDTEAETLTTQRGYRLATSVGGTLTGRGGTIEVGPGEDHPVVREHPATPRRQD